MKKTKAAVCIVLAFCFAALTAYSAQQFWLIRGGYRAEAKLRGTLKEYKPEGTPGRVNQSVIDLQKKHPQVVGWLVVPNTKIDYPFVRGEDNAYYLRRDINGKDALAGTIFMDYRCEKDFSSKNTMIYGHHMKNKTMFGTLNAFNDRAFFENNHCGVIYLPRETLRLDFFAFLVVQPDTLEIYATEPGSAYHSYVKQNARYYRDIGLTNEDKIITLSTCAYEFHDARMVLIARGQSDTR